MSVFNSFGAVILVIYELCKKPLVFRSVMIVN